MLDKKTFIEGIKTIQVIFDDFELNQQQTEIWYSILSKYTDEQYQYMIKLYLSRSEWKPKTPYSLVKFLEEEMSKQLITKELNADQAWNLVITAIRTHGINYKWDVEKTIKYIEVNGNPELSKIFKQYFREFETLDSSDTFLMNNFKKSYDALLKRKIEDKHLELTNQNIKNLIGEELKRPMLEVKIDEMPTTEQQKEKALTEEEKKIALKLLNGFKLK